MVLPFLYPAAAIFIFAALIEATCYNPDRTVASNAVPCSSDNATFCCGTGAICLSTGYCLGATTQPYTLYRGSCTDSGWGSFCAYYCGRFLSTSRLIRKLDWLTLHSKLRDRLQRPDCQRGTE